MWKKSLAIAALAGGAVMSASAYPITPEDAANLLRNMDSENVEVTTISDEISRIDAQRNGYYYSVRMMDCVDDRGCNSVMQFATWSMDGSPDFEMYEKINHYNDSYPFGRAFIYQGGEEGYSVGVDYVIDLSDEQNYNDDDVEMFFNVIESFVGHLWPGE